MAILFADDEPGLQEVMRSELPRMGHTVTVCPDGLTAVAALERNAYDCLLVDLDMPGMNGIEVIQRAKQMYPDVAAVVLTGKASQDTAIAALRQGAFDYLTKPCRLADLATLLGRVAEHRKISRQVAALQLRVQRAEGDGRLIGSHASIEAVRKLVAKVAPTESTVMIRGETGSGKELVARSVHDQSLRADKPFVAINCGALPESLIESELFGHCRGAFTGADAARTGLFEVANDGSLFLDEIGELPLSMQAKLLRVLESGEIRRVGDNQTTKIDVRVICATHRDLEAMVEEGTFREDLMFRINTFEIQIPPLRNRASDILPLAAHLLRRFRNDSRSDDQLFSDEAKELLLAHVWPGNVRELANVVEHASILCDALPILPEHLPRQFSERQLRKELRTHSPTSLRDMELAAIEDALERHDGKKPAAAHELGISLKTLYNKLNAASEKRAAG
ncbi:sigma-54-dependent transcriptional regulator [Candidatus Laterigemmans baculatus]|uniref:sigma-54-dependent transcriptional regulator n=1 Tax=Candidatus Laterigemmans baculatus TaxID=2770505 RepID=UPI0013DA4988|nr:sigma-54 dependent transcriptional regulator [Candidatus Laterigemmans baculatus]